MRTVISKLPYFCTQILKKQLLSRGGGRLEISCVPMCEQKNDDKGYFFLAGQCAVLSSFRVGKCYFYRKRVCFFTILQKVGEVREYAF